MCLILLYWYEKSLPKDLQKYYDLNCSDWIEKIRSVCDMIGLQKSFHDNFSVVKPSGMGQNTSNDILFAPRRRVPQTVSLKLHQLARSRVVLDCLKDFPRSGIDTVIPLTPKTLHPVNSLRDLSRQLVQFSAWPAPIARRARLD